MNKARVTDHINQTIENTAASLAAAYHDLKHFGSATEAGAVLELFEKVKNEQFAIAFCGHFSAGKSSMINELLNDNILPSSPIPTSANVVKLQTGDPSAKVKIRGAGTVRLDPPVNLNDIKKWAKNGEAIESIEINVEQGILPDRIAIYDTPGIDSTDDAHKVATESALHMADVVFYMMDYNHVLSQLNFTFVRLLKEQGKKLYLIVNQIDKHNEKEISFDDFKERVKEGFKSWDIEPEEIFFTTIMDKDHPGNQLKEIKTLFQKFFLAKEEWIQENALKEASGLISKAVQSKLDQDEEKYSTEFQILEQSDESEVREIYEDLVNQKNALTKASSDDQSMAGKRFKDILDNAILMPFSTRDLAKSYIESRQDGFKVGLLFSAKKTEAERSARLHAFYESVLENIKTQISWHLKDYFSSYDVRVENEPVMTAEQLASLIKPGASLNGNYVLQYCNDVTEDIKRMMASHYRSEIERIKEHMENKKETEAQSINRKIADMENILQAIQKANEIKAHWMEFQEGFLETLYGKELQQQAVDEAEQALASKESSLSSLPTDWNEDKQDHSAHVQGEEQQPEAVEKETANEASLEQEAKKLDGVSRILSRIEVMQGVSQDMKNYSKRLMNREFTVSLFGAFSAGKSSFANALIGEELLPVSPNPTTATINRILPPNEEHQHGTAVIAFKQESALLEEINQSLAEFGLKADELQQAITAAGQADSKNSSDQLRPHLQFLKAVNQGYNEAKKLLGNEIEVSIKEFQAFVADEDKACFTESISVYYDCRLTRMGVTLVDTPGADSINARHTNVAFEFIKKSDAILYVTYYNHAFSAADREFLIQLGRVKDTFELDKMFFVINASDLAKDQEELKDVVSHVGDNLQQFGIRHPKLYALSSYYSMLAQRNALEDSEQQSLNKKYPLASADDNTLLKETGFTPFMNAFQSFLDHDLSLVLVNSAAKHMDQAKRRLEHFIEQAEKSKENAERRREELANQSRRAIEAVQQFPILSKKESLEKEIQELLFYVKQRVMLRFTEFFNEAFNPSVLTGSVREQKSRLPECLKELHKRIEFDLQQESRATVLRVEKHLVRVITEMNEELNEITHSYDAPQYLMQKENLEMETMKIETSLMPLTGYEPVLKEFKNARHFFEEGGKKQTMEKMQDLFDPTVQRYTEDSVITFEAYYESLLNDLVDTEKARRTKEYDQYYRGLLLALDSPEVVETMKQSMNEINELNK